MIKYYRLSGYYLSTVYLYCSFWAELISVPTDNHVKGRFADCEIPFILINVRLHRLPAATTGLPCLSRPYTSLSRTIHRHSGRLPTGIPYTPLSVEGLCRETTQEGPYCPKFWCDRLRSFMMARDALDSRPLHSEPIVPSTSPNGSWGSTP